MRSSKLLAYWEHQPKATSIENRIDVLYYYDNTVVVKFEEPL